MDKITEALKLAEEALNAMLTHMGMDEDEWTKPTFNQAREALAAIREASADHVANVGKMVAEPVKQEPVMDYEHICALREGEQHQAEDSYFFVRPENDTPTSRKMFCQGFERGFHKGLKYAAPVERQWVDLTDDEIYHALAEVRFVRDNLLDGCRAVIAADREKNRG